MGVRNLAASFPILLVIIDSASRLRLYIYMYYLHDMVQVKVKVMRSTYVLVRKYLLLWCLFESK